MSIFIDDMYPWRDKDSRRWSDLLSLQSKQAEEQIAGLQAENDRLLARLTSVEALLLQERLDGANALAAARAYEKELEERVARLELQVRLLLPAGE